MYNFSKVILLLLLLLLVSCSEKNGTEVSEVSEVSEVDPRFEPDSALKKISFSASILDVNLRVKNNVYCNLSKELDHLRNDLLTKEVAETYTGLCELYDKATELYSSTISEMKLLGKIPVNTYSFSIFIKNNDYMGNTFYSENEIGIFLTQESCHMVKRIAEAYKIPTKACGEWIDILEKYTMPNKSHQRGQFTA